MAKCLIGSALALFWSFMLLFGFTVVFSILIVQQFTIFLSDHKANLDSTYTKNVQQAFGSVWLGVLSLFQAISGGTDWGVYLEMVQKTGSFNTTIFLLYIFFVWLSVTNIIISIFVDKAMKLAQPDIDDRLLAKRKVDLQNVRDLKNLFNSMDVNKSGTLSAEELQKCIEDVRMASYFEMKGLDIKDAEVFFSMLTSMSGDNEVDVLTFVTGWLKMKGPATSLDVYTMQYQTQLWENKVQQQLRECRKNILDIYEEITTSKGPHPEQRHQKQDPELQHSRNEDGKDMTKHLSDSSFDKPDALQIPLIPDSDSGEADQTEMVPDCIQIPVVPETFLVETHNIAYTSQGSFAEDIDSEVDEMAGVADQQDSDEDTTPNNMALPGQMSA